MNFNWESKIMYKFDAQIWTYETNYLAILFMPFDFDIVCPRIGHV